MFKRLPILCAALLALAACSHDNNTATAPATPVASSTASTPVATASTAPVSTDTSNTASSSSAAAPSAAGTADATPAAATPTVAAAPFVDNGKWVEGKNYFVIDPAQPTSHPGKIEVTEVFSYGCPACNQFHTTADEIAKNLPSDAVMNYLPSNMRPDENWTIYQRAYFAAQALGVADKTYDAMFDATWKTGETATYDLSQGRPKPRAAWPTIETLAKFYAKYGVDPKEFLAVANSFTVNTKMAQADQLQKSYGVEETPTMIINGKYRFTPVTAGGYPQTVELTQWLVSKIAAGK